MDKLIAAVIVAVTTILVFPVMSALFAVPVWLLWDGIAPTVFGLREITFMQAWGLTVLCAFLFKSNASFTTK